MKTIIGQAFICGPVNTDLLAAEKKFSECEEVLNSYGVKTINQFLLFNPGGIQHALKNTVQFLAGCNAIVTLPFWASCPFAKKQVEVARILDIEVIDYNKLVLDLTKNNSHA